MPQRSPNAARPPRHSRRIIVTTVIVALVGVVAFFPVALATDQPAFCPSCHDMQPFYSAWGQGKHKDVWCIDCHVDAGYPNRFLHKFAALQEVYAELFVHPGFPNYNADIPNARCLRCHKDVPTKIAAVGHFSHAQHLARGVHCATCHATTAHQVSFASLDALGVLNRSQVTSGATYVGEQPQGLSGKHSVLPGHRPVPCSNCHDQANLECSYCHDTPANHFGAECKLCHKPTVPFAQFSHPPTGEHDYRSRPCVRCHPNGYTTVFCTCHNGHPPTGG